MRKECFILIITTFCWYSDLAGQSLPGRPSEPVQALQSVYAELGGVGSIYSANYDVVFDTGFGVRIGGSYLPAEFVDIDTDGPQNYNDDFYGTDYLMVTLMGSYFVGNGPNYLELSAGFMFGEKNLNDEELSIEVPDPPGMPFSFGYRYIPEKAGKMTFKVAFTPIIAEGKIYPKIGISAGIVISGEEK
ncbi:MAG: hypothetical protein R3281_12135 [Balneolaceae bacterium]|nr:hypothetical protein [Balneolaceae bacterium]